MSLNLNPDIEARLIALAQSSGVSVEEFLLRVVEEKSGQAPALRLDPEQRAEQVRRMGRQFPRSSSPAGRGIEPRESLPRPLVPAGKGFRCRMGF
jgi:hypothetical protein